MSHSIRIMHRKFHVCSSDLSIVLGYPVEQLALDLLLWLPGIQIEKELQELLVETVKG